MSEISTGLPSLGAKIRKEWIRYKIAATKIRSRGYGFMVFNRGGCVIPKISASPSGKTTRRIKNVLEKAATDKKREKSQKGNAAHHHIAWLSTWDQNVSCYWRNLTKDLLGMHFREPISQHALRRRFLWIGLNPSTPATTSKQHCQMLQSRVSLRRSRTLLRHCCWCGSGLITSGSWRKPGGQNSSSKC